jgi:hypothetical protein
VETQNTGISGKQVRTETEQLQPDFRVVVETTLAGKAGPAIAAQVGKSTQAAGLKEFILAEIDGSPEAGSNGNAGG